MKNTKTAVRPIIRLFAMALSLLVLVTAILPTTALAAEDADFKKLRNEWRRHDQKGSLWIEYYIHQDSYAHYADLDRVYGVESLVDYVNDPWNRQFIAQFVNDCFASMPDFTGYSKNQVVDEMVAFVQGQIRYETDLDTTGTQEYPRYPVETLYLGYGDCEDSSILLACMLREYGYNVALLYLPNHIAVAIKADDDYQDSAYYQTEQGRYLFIETTYTGWNIGDIPEEFQNCGAEFIWL